MVPDVRRPIAALAAVLALALCATRAGATPSVALDRDHRSSVLLEILFPTFEDGDSDFPTWSWYLSGRLPVSNTLWITPELPYARGDFGALEGSKIGNPYLGIEYAPHPDKGVRLEAGARIPVVDANDLEDLAPILVGLYTDLERQEAFYPDLLPIHLAAHYHRSALAAPNHWGFDVRAEPEVWIPVGDNDGDTELVLGYLGQVQYAARDFRVGAGFTGKWDATGDGDFGEDSFHQLDLMADFLHGSIRPGLQLKLPLDSDLSDVVNYTWGLSVNVLPNFNGD